MVHVHLRFPQITKLCICTQKRFYIPSNMDEKLVLLLWTFSQNYSFSILVSVLFAILFHLLVIPDVVCVGDLTNYSEALCQTHKKIRPLEFIVKGYHYYSANFTQAFVWYSVLYYFAINSCGLYSYKIYLYSRCNHNQCLHSDIFQLLFLLTLINIILFDFPVAKCS